MTRFAWFSGDRRYVFASCLESRRVRRARGLVPRIDHLTYLAGELVRRERLGKDKAEAFYKSKAWNDLTPQREKAVKTIRRYAVEAVN